MCTMQSLQIIDFTEAQKEYGLVPHDIRFSSSFMLEARSHTPSDFMESLLQVMTKLFPEQRVWLSRDSNCRIEVEGRDVFVEVSSFEPTQDIVVNWNFRVSE